MNLLFKLGPAKRGSAEILCARRGSGLTEAAAIICVDGSELEVFVLEHAQPGYI